MMERVYMAIYLDEDVSPVIGRILRSHSFDVSWPSEIGRLGLTDEEQLTYAVREKKSFFTHNKVDFIRLHQNYISQRKKHYGIILGARRQNNYEVARRLLRFLKLVNPGEMDTQLRYV